MNDATEPEMGEQSTDRRDTDWGGAEEAAGGEPYADTSSSGGSQSIADDILDQLLPEGFDWRDKVLRYPRISLSVAAIGGFLLARSHGAAVTAGLSGLASRRVREGLSGIFDREEAEV